MCNASQMYEKIICDNTECIRILNDRVKFLSKILLVFVLSKILCLMSARTEREGAGRGSD
jgi:hypothetical protein